MALLRQMIPELFPRVHPFLLRALNGEAIQGVKVVRPSFPGKADKTILLSYQPAFDEAHEVIGISVAVMDVSQRSQS